MYINILSRPAYYLAGSFGPLARMKIKKNKNGPCINLWSQTAGAHKSFFAYSAPTVVCAPHVHKVLRSTLFIKLVSFFFVNAYSIDGVMG